MGVSALSAGDTGEGVALLQQGLSEMGYAIRDEPGTFGEETGEAVRLYNRTNGKESDVYEVPPKPKQPAKKAPTKKAKKASTKKG